MTAINNQETFIGDMFQVHKQKQRTNLSFWRAWGNACLPAEVTSHWGIYDSGRTKNIIGIYIFSDIEDWRNIFFERKKEEES